MFDCQHAYLLCQRHSMPNVIYFLIHPIVLYIVIFCRKAFPYHYNTFLSHAKSMIVIWLQIPPFRDLAKWNNRMLSNLLYYQTNYFAFMLIIILICASVQLRDVFIGLGAIICVATGLIFSVSSNPTFVQVGRLLLFILVEGVIGQLIFVVW